MFKSAAVIFIYTETSLHAGSGAGVGVIDLPIQREKYTDYPVLQASGIKGALRDYFESSPNKEHADSVNAVFGPDTIGGPGDAFAGAASFTDGRLLLFPVRSLRGVFAYTTSALALSRLKRDLEMTGRQAPWRVPNQPTESVVLTTPGSAVTEGDKVVLEEYLLTAQPSEDVAAIAGWLSAHALSPAEEYTFWREKMKTSLVVVADEVFTDFVKLSTEVQARIRIKNDTKTVDQNALFYEEALTADTLLYTVAMANAPFAKKFDGLKTDQDVMRFLSALDGKRTQFGGDVTIGKGIVALKLVEGGEA